MRRHHVLGMNGLAGLLCGAAGFLLFPLYDLRAAQGRRFAGAFFALGGLLLAAGTAIAITAADLPAAFASAPALFCFGALGAAASLGLLVHVLFFALPFKRTYCAGEEKQTVRSGWYALCRHPGVIWLAALYLSLWAMARTAALFGAMLLFTALDVLYVLWQERYVFSHTLAGYADYQRATPFLIPTRASIRAMRGGRKKVEV